MTSGTQPGDGATRALSRNALALHVSTVVNSGLGFVFMVVAAQLYEQDAFGRDMALVSAMMLLAAVAELNLGLSLPRFIPKLGDRSARTVLLSYAVSSVVAAVLATLFVLIVPRVIGSLDFLATSIALSVAFVAAVILWNIFAIQDAVLAALRRATWIPIENGVFGLLKIALMVIWVNSSIENGIFFAWVVPMALLVIPVSGAIFGFAIPRHVAATADRDTEGIDLGGKRQIFRYLGLDYVASLLSQAGTSMLPLVVIAILGAEANASFAIAFAIVTAVEQLALNVGLSLTVEGAFDKAALARLVRHTLFRFGTFLLLLVGIAIVAAPLILWPFGDPYSDTATTVLRLLLLGAIPQAILIVYETVERIRGNAGRIVLSTLAQTATTLVFAIALAGPLGLAGIGWGWVIGNSLVALTAVPTLIRVMKQRGPAETARATK